MFDKNLIPPQNPKLTQHLTGLYGHVGASADLKAVIILFILVDEFKIISFFDLEMNRFKLTFQIIDKKLDKVDQTMKDKILSTLTISEYFDQQWKQADLKDADKEVN